MRDKINYILGGIAVLLFSMVASTGLLQRGGGLFHRSPGIMGEIEGYMAIHLGQLHRWLALFFLLFGVLLIIRYWSWIVSMTEIIKMERAASEDIQNHDEQADPVNNEDAANECASVVTPISEDEVEELEQELDEAAEGDEIDEIEELDDEGKEDDDNDSEHKE